METKINEQGRITREELITSEEYMLGNIQFDLYSDIKNYIKSKDLTQTEFAEDLGVSKGYISQVLNGDFDHKLSRLIRLYKAIGKVVIGIKTEDINAYIAKDKSNKESVTLTLKDLSDFQIQNQDIDMLYVDQEPEPKETRTLMFNNLPFSSSLALRPLKVK